MTAPVRIEMIEKLMPKLLNPPMVRTSSCAYPRPCRSLTSCRIASSRLGICDLPPDGRPRARFAAIIRAARRGIRRDSRGAAGAGRRRPPSVEERRALGELEVEGRCQKRRVRLEVGDPGDARHPGADRLD